MAYKKEKYTLRQWRVLKDIRVNELASETGLTERTINNYERSIDGIRKASFNNLDLIAGALGISVSDIYLSPDSEKPKFPVKQPA
ncbi:helix-turn-helix domain-containing protein [Lactiplantibacillus plantarum]